MAKWKMRAFAILVVLHRLLSKSAMKYYLPPRHLVTVSVCVPAATIISARDVARSTTALFHTREHLSTFTATLGDFNHVTMDRAMANFTQHAERPLDLLCANTKEQIIISSSVFLEESQPVRRWSREATEVMQGCFEVTGWQDWHDALVHSHICLCIVLFVTNNLTHIQ